MSGLWLPSPSFFHSQTRKFCPNLTVHPLLKIIRLQYDATVSNLYVLSHDSLARDGSFQAPVFFPKTLLRKPTFLNIVQKSSLLIDIFTSPPELNSFKIFCLGSFLLAEIILAMIRSVKLLSLGFWPCNFCLGLSPVFLNCCTILNPVLLHIGKFLAIPDTLTPFWNILHVATLTPLGIWQRFMMIFGFKLRRISQKTPKQT